MSCLDEPSLFPILSDKQRVATRWGFSTNQIWSIFVYLYFQGGFSCQPHVAQGSVQDSFLFNHDLGGGFKCFLFSPLFGEDYHFDWYFFRWVGTTNQWWYEYISIIHIQFSQHDVVSHLQCTRSCRCWAVGPLRRVDDRKAYGYPVAYQEGGAEMNRLL